MSNVIRIQVQEQYAARSSGRADGRPDRWWFRWGRWWREKENCKDALCTTNQSVQIFLFTLIYIHDKNSYDIGSSCHLAAWWWRNPPLTGFEFALKTKSKRHSKTIYSKCNAHFLFLQKAAIISAQFRDSLLIGSKPESFNRDLQNFEHSILPF